MNNFVTNKNREELEREADKYAMEAFNVVSRWAAYNLLDQGHFRGTWAETRMNNYRFLLGEESD